MGFFFQIVPNSTIVIRFIDRHTHRQTHTQTDTQTDRHTDRHDRKHYLPTYTGGNNAKVTFLE